MHASHRNCPPSASWSVSAKPGSGGDDGYFKNNNGGKQCKKKLTRQKKLRYVTDEEIGLSFVNRSNDSPDSDHWSLSAVPKPLPLPALNFLRRPALSFPYSGEGRRKHEEICGAAMVRWVTIFTLPSISLLIRFFSQVIIKFVFLVQLPVIFCIDFPFIALLGAEIYYFVKVVSESESSEPNYFQI